MSAARKLRRAQARSAPEPVSPTNDLGAIQDAVRYAMGGILSQLELRDSFESRGYRASLAGSWLAGAAEIEPATDRAPLSARGMLAARNIVLNLRQRLHAHPSALTFGRPLAGRWAIVLGAGPSLEHHVHLLPRWRERAAILCTNSSWGLVSRHVEPDAVISGEHLDLTAHLERGSGRAALAVLTDTAAPAMWPAAERIAPIVSWYESLLFGERHGIEQTVVLAARLAYEWGASGVVLLGCDLTAGKHSAGTSHGDAAQPGARAPSYLEDMRRSGLPAPNDYEKIAASRVSIAGWGGAPVETLEALWGPQRRFLEQFALDHPGLDLIQASEGGARLNGWAEVAPDDVKLGPVVDRPLFAPGRARALSREACEAKLAEYRDCALDDIQAVRDLARGDPRGCRLFSRRGIWPQDRMASSAYQERNLLNARANLLAHAAASAHMLRWLDGDERLVPA